MSNQRACPVCGAMIPVTRKCLPHDHDDSAGTRQSHADFDVLVPHSYAKEPGLSRCEGSGAIFELP